MLPNLTFLFSFLFSVTRQTSQLLEENGITKELKVMLDRNFKIEALSFLNRAQPQPQTLQTRRASVAGTKVFVVDGRIRETGFDYLERLRRDNHVQISQPGQSTPAATQNFSMVLAKPTDRATNITSENGTPRTPPHAASAASVVGNGDLHNNTTPTAALAACSIDPIIGASVINSMDSFQSLARSVPQIDGNFILSHSLNFERVQIIPDDEVVDEDSLFGDLSDVSDDVDGLIKELEPFDDSQLIDLIGNLDLEWNATDNLDQFDAQNSGVDRVDDNQGDFESAAVFIEQPEPNAPSTIENLDQFGAHNNVSVNSVSSVDDNQDYQDDFGIAALFIEQPDTNAPNTTEKLDQCDAPNNSVDNNQADLGAATVLNEQPEPNTASINLCNNFDPFERVASSNIPFYTCGRRRRAASVYLVSGLPTIFEN